MSTLFISATKVGGVEFLGYAFDDRSMGYHLECPYYAEQLGAYSGVLRRYQMYGTRLSPRCCCVIVTTSRDDICCIRSCVGCHCSVASGHGTVVMANVVIMPNARIGNHCTVLAGCTIGHDSLIGDSSTYASTSRVVLGVITFYGMNSTINTRAQRGSQLLAALFLQDLRTGKTVGSGSNRIAAPT